jgi:hypothetical protein
VPGSSPADVRPGRLLPGTSSPLPSAASRAARGGGRLCQGLVQAGEVGITWSMPVIAKTRRTAAAGTTSSTSRPSARALLCAAARACSPDESQNWVWVISTTSVPGPTAAALKQGRPQPISVGDVDLCGRGHHRHAVDHRYRDTRYRSWATCLSGRHLLRGARWACTAGSGQGGTLGTPGPAGSSTVIPWYSCVTAPVQDSPGHRCPGRVCRVPPRRYAGAGTELAAETGH